MESTAAHAGRLFGVGQGAQEAVYLRALALPGGIIVVTDDMVNLAANDPSFSRCSRTRWDTCGAGTR